MSRILRRPMFRGGPIDSRGTGITSGLAGGGRVGYQPGGIVTLQDILAKTGAPMTGQQILDFAQANQMNLGPNFKINPKSKFIPETVDVTVGEDIISKPFSEILREKGFQQAQAAAAQDLAAQQGLGQYQQTMGQAGQAQQQAILDASAAAEREAQFQPFTQLGLIGQQLAQIQPGAFPTQTVGYAPPAAPASPLATALGVGTGIASIGSKL